MADSFLIEVPVPSMGATVNELTVIDVRVKAGERVAKGQKVAELESDKSVFEFEMPCEGTIEAVLVRAGDIVASGKGFLRVQTADEVMRYLEVKGGGAVAAKAAVELPAGGKLEVKPAVAKAVEWTPRALTILREARVDVSETEGILGTGPGGRVSGDDVTKWLEVRKKELGAQGEAVKKKQADDETVRVCGVGYAVPKKVRATRELVEKFPDRTEEEMIKLTGIKERRMAERDETAAGLAELAVLRALTDAGMKVDELDGIVFATIIPDQPVPSTAASLAKRLGIPHVFAFDVNAACSGWLFALEVGRAFIQAGTAHKVLVVTAELLSRITNPEDQETAFLFGDGAGAAVLSDDEGGHRLHRLELSGDAKLFDAIQRPGGGANRPVPNESGSDRGDFFLKMDGGAVFKSAVVAFSDEIEGVLERFNLKPEEVKWVVPHQANERILRAVGKRVGIDYERFIVTIGRYGNTSGASVSMALAWAAKEGIFAEGDKLVICSVGAGMTFAGGLLVW